MPLMLLELVVQRRKVLDEVVTNVKDLVDCFDIPESPAGYPAPASLAVATYVKAKYGVCAIPHVRLCDVNELALRSAIKAARVFDLNALVVTVGDPPRYGRCASDLTTDEAVRLIKELGYGVRVGSIISLRYDLRDIEERLSNDSDFYYVLRLDESSFSKYEEVVDMARSYGKELYPYVIVVTPANEELLNRLGQPRIKLVDLRPFIQKLRGRCSGLVVSSPLEHQLLPQILGAVREVLRGG